MAMLPTYQDFMAATDVAGFIQGAITTHRNSDAYRIAADADEYDAQRNVTINRFMRKLYSMSGVRYDDFTASNNRIASNFFANLNMQRVSYSLGAGVSFVQVDEDALEDRTKEAMGDGFDHSIHEAAYDALKHGVSFCFWNRDHVNVFMFTEFVPIWDEFDGSLRAGIRFWQLDKSRPMSVTLYREEGYSEWRQDGERRLRPLDREGNQTDAEVVQPYKTTVAYVPADDSAVIVGEENYGALPIVPMWASRLKQSTLVGLRGAIDAYDLIKSGFANDVQDCAQIFWILKNADGMDEADMQEFMDRLRLQHVVKVNGYDGSEAVPYTQEVPYQARQAVLAELRNGMYEDFGALDVHAVAAGATNDHIDAAYQPVDEKAADFEYWVGRCISQLLKLAGIGDAPVFQRMRISNQKEQVEMVVQEAQWLDQRTILQLLPNISAEQVGAILERADDEDMERFGIGAGTAQTPPAAAFGV